MLHLISVQATLVESLISNYHSIFTDDEPQQSTDGMYL